MLKTYKYIKTDHQNLHNNIMAFFDKIEFETGAFETRFFDPLFYNNIVKHHPRILEVPLVAIYNEIRTWTQIRRSYFIQRIRDSNDIEGICNRNIVPISIDKVPKLLKDKIDLKKLAKDLYEQVLKGQYFSSTYGTLQSHFSVLKKKPNDFLMCPACGLSPAKSFEETRDQYDHYLHKDKYICSSVNFKNLVPICTDCNSILIKGTFDVLEENGNKRIFFPYDETHKGITISAQIVDDKKPLNEIDFKFDYSTIDDRDEEIESWRAIYKIDYRYKVRAKGAFLQWYTHYWELMNNPMCKNMNEIEKKALILNILSTDENTEKIKGPVLKALDQSILTKAMIEARNYSMEYG